MLDTAMASEEHYTLLICIGCGAVEMGPTCTGTCDERRLELVPGAAHASVVDALGRTRAGLAEARALLRRLAAAAGDDPEPAYRELQVRARTVLAGLPARELPEAVSPVTAWACASCGRIEAPQPCIGVCIRRPERMVPASAHAELLAELDGARRDAGPAFALTMRLAWSTPRPGQWRRSLRALGDAAAALKRPG